MTNNLKGNIKVRENNKTPNFSGVPGEFVQEETLQLEFSSGRKSKFSPYDILLKQLVEKPIGTILKFTDIRAEASLKNRAKKLELKLAFAQKDNNLYVKYLGSSHFEVTEEIKDNVLSILKDFSPSDSRKISKHLNHKGIEISIDNVEEVMIQLRHEKEVTVDSIGMWGLS